MLQIGFITIFAYKTASHQQRSVIDYVEIFDSPTRSEVMQSISCERMKSSFHRTKGDNPLRVLEHSNGNGFQ